MGEEPTFAPQEFHNEGIAEQSIEQKVASFEKRNPEQRKEYLTNLLRRSFSEVSAEVIAIFKKAIGPLIEEQGQMSKDSRWGISTADAERCLFDLVRTKRFQEALDEVIKEEDVVAEANISSEETVLEAGAGTGVLALLAAARGAKKVYAVEINPQTARVCQKFIKFCGFDDKIEILEGDATNNNFKLPENVDVIISENMYTGLLEEPQMQIIENLKRFLKEGGRIIPEKFKSYIELATVSGDIGTSKVRRDVSNVTRIISGKVQYDEVSFDRKEPLGLDKSVEIEATEDAMVNAVNISSVIELTKKIRINSNECDFLGQDEVVALKTPIRVEKGKRYLIHINYKGGDRARDVRIEITPVEESE